MRRCTHGSLWSAGCITYQVTYDEAVPDQFILIEEWSSAEVCAAPASVVAQQQLMATFCVQALAAHDKTPHLSAARTAWRDGALLAAAPAVLKLRSAL